MRLSLGCTFSDRIEALLDGRIVVEGFDIDVHVVEPQRLFRQTLRDQTFDVAELSMASHIAAVGQGRRDYVDLPVFLSRSFRHSNLYVRTDRGIERPEHLAGKRIGLIDFQQTAALWLRGILADDHGVERTSVDWITAGLHAPVLDDRMALMLPDGIRVERSASTLDALLRDGAIDAVISPTAPRCFADAQVPVARLWPDTRAEEVVWWHRRRVFPIMHVAVVRRTLVEQHPELTAVLCAAFEQARRLAAADLVARDFPKVAMPWLVDSARDAHVALGGDPWTYGLEANRETIATMLRYAAADGLTPELLAPEALFA